MSDPIRTPCPKCRNVLKVRREYVGKRVACKHCGHVFLITDSEADEGSESAASARATAVVGPPTETFAGISTLPGSEQAIEQLERENARLRSALDQAIADAARLRDDLENARSQGDDADATQADRDRLQHDLDTARDEADRLRSQVDELTTLNQQLLDDHEADVARLGQEAREARQTWESEQASSLSSWESRVRDTESVSEQLRAEVVLLTKQLQEASDATETARRDGEVERSRLDGELDALRKETDGLRLQLAEAHLELDQLRGECQRLRTDGTRLDQALREADTAHRIEVESLQRDLDELREQHATVGNQADEHRQLADSLRIELESTRKRSEEAARATAEELERQQKAHLGERQEWQTERERLHAAAAETSAGHAQAIADLEGRHKTLTGSAENLARDLELATAARAKLEADMAARNLENQDLKAQLVLAQDFRHQIRSFLAGLGIKLPG